ncbi:MAG TPA: sigma-54 dependent transcriptional regulator [Blastocatellia bacterium]|nr:sigma-54 dependent transcriptional regulator [Blastocatellia bacterium]
MESREFVSRTRTGSFNGQTERNRQSFALHSLELQQFSLVDQYLIGNSSSVQELKRLVEQAARHRCTVLITGESGTGKELVARAIHQLSRRASSPFVAVNCAALTESLFESELFGYVKGAFTGAVSNKKGLFQSAHGGTLFLDELGEMPPAMQVKLLRVLQENKVRPVGATDDKEIEIDIRVIAATNRELKSEIELGHFRQDLYFRLNVFELKLPPLRERRDDIPILVHHFLRKIAKRAELNAPTEITEEAVARLSEYGWPGNVRELENILERLSIIAESGSLITDDYVETAIGLRSHQLLKDRPCQRQIDSSPDLILMRRQLNEYEQALQKSGGNCSAAARYLGISRTTFCRRRQTLKQLLSKCERLLKSNRKSRNDEK